MKLFRRIYYFLGSIYLAIGLISLSALFVITGTFIEAKTDSHRYAALFTYGSPVFSSLLWGFFVNILLSALRRWPFKRHHIPFLITHFGLLMILAGVLIKNYLGLQGTLTVMEGSGSQEVYLQDRRIVRLEKKDPSTGSILTKKVLLPQNLVPGEFYSLKEKDGGFGHIFKKKEYDPFAEVELQILAYSPHSYERIETWIKEDYAGVSGGKPLPVRTWSAEKPFEQVQTKLRFGKGLPWNLAAYRSADISSLIEQYYAQHCRIIITDTLSRKVLHAGSLESLLQKTLKIPQGSVSGKLELCWSSIEGFQDPALIIDIEGEFYNDSTAILLQGPDALRNQNNIRSCLGESSISVSLECIPSILFIEDPQGDLFLFAFEQHGRVFSQPYRRDNLNEVIAYDGGFGGYAVHAKLPFCAFSCSRDDLEAAELFSLVRQLQECIASVDDVAPPLKCLYEACLAHHRDFAEVCVQFLSHWNKCQSWLYPSSVPLPESLVDLFAGLNWKSLPSQTVKGCKWIGFVFDRLDPMLRTSCNLGDTLSRIHWPLLDSIYAASEQKNLHRQSDWDAALSEMTKQIFAISHQLPDLPSTPRNGHLSALESLAGSNAQLLSAYLRGYSIHLSQIRRPITEEALKERLKGYFLSKKNNANIEEENGQALLQAKQSSLESYPEFETSAAFKQIPAEPLKKMENNRPMILLKVVKGDAQDVIALGYDQTASGLKQPILDGQYLVRFQPDYTSIPYRLRLRQARQINYPQSQQAYSYESDLIVTEALTNNEMEKTISMNHVHETWDGYRFYLSNIAPADPGAVKRVQIAVNRDPAKYILTYPGAIILTLGIVLLFWVRPYRTKNF